MRSIRKWWPELSVAFIVGGLLPLFLYFQLPFMLRLWLPFSLPFWLLLIGVVLVFFAMTATPTGRKLAQLLTFNRRAR